ncbi:MAG: NAD-dependent epimerase/dehydratase family protein [Acidobacteria bacterium]|nr:NAD-dependent epimerase/dehydratase family protein [Acidobacteriota bacterium]
MKILVTGGAGFIGSHVVEAYLATGHEVCVVDDLSTGFRRNVPENVCLHEVDIRSEQLAKVFAEEKPEVVNHQAARANVRESFEKPLLYTEVNVVGSVNVLECCRQFGVRKVIYASTGGAVYGEPQSLPVSEDHPIHPLDPYGASKHHVEHFLHIYKSSFGIDFTVLRYPNVFGPRQDPLGEAGVVAIFIGKMLNKAQPIINGTGDQERDFVFVLDVARASVLALNRAGGEILNIGSGIPTSVNQVFEALNELTEFKGAAVHGPAKAGEVYRIFLDADRAAEKLGWKPEISLREGLRRTVEYFKTIVL